METEIRKMEALLPIKKVLEISSLKRTTLYGMIKAGEFPQSVPLRDYGRRVGWIESQVQAWVKNRIDKAQQH